MTPRPDSLWNRGTSRHAIVWTELQVEGRGTAARGENTVDISRSMPRGYTDSWQLWTRARYKDSCWVSSSGSSGSWQAKGWQTGLGGQRQLPDLGGAIRRG